MPTVLAAAATESTGSLPLVGRDLIEQLTDDTPDKRTLFFEHEGNRAVRQGNWKLVALKDQRWELYDVSRVRTETENLIDQHPDIARNLSGAWDRWAAKNQVTPLPNDYGVGYLKVTKPQ